MGCEVRRLGLPSGHCHGFRDVQLRGDGVQRAHLLLARPVGIKASELWYLFSNQTPSLDLVWVYGQCFSASSCSATKIRDFPAEELSP